jgi:hypothetical protein
MQTFYKYQKALGVKHVFKYFIFRSKQFFTNSTFIFQKYLCGVPPKLSRLLIYEACFKNKKK